MKPIMERFEAKISPEPMSGCWLWVGAIDGSGYGQMNINGKTVKSHRLSYAHFVAPIPPGYCVCHKCDTPACVNPDHLYVGTFKDNAVDKVKKGRMVMGIGNAPDLKRKQTHCIHGHLFNAKNTYYRPRGGRQCRKCTAVSTRKYLKKKALTPQPAPAQHPLEAG